MGALVDFFYTAAVVDGAAYLLWHPAAIIRPSQPHAPPSPLQINQVDFPKALATKSPTACAPIPYGDVPPPLANAIASFCSSVGFGLGAVMGVLQCALQAKEYKSCQI